ncbi:aspartate aminotransferase [Lentzea fradiae]|uniref:Aspartate aminotransferase n=1 Tax=Lentzea fradiae TaxID=200378 RepID=A0A1G8CTM8_9PSEU|nr:pyridoxal phosphate-dependent aminotransferase [Lentzea fradiae]SDH48633.1 aspartate aminotransferase [Lentzea fradiae]
MSATATRWMAGGFEQQDAIVRFRRARGAIEGLDRNGVQVAKGWSDPSVISLAHGEGVRRPHPDVIAAGVRALLDTEESSLDNYLYLRPFKTFDEAVAQDFLAEGVPEEYARHVCVESGNTRLFMGFFNAVANPGDIVLVPQTYYQALNMWADIARVELRVVRTRREDDYVMTADALDAWFAENPADAGRTKAVVLFNPSYTGALYSEAVLEALADRVLAHDLAVLEDSIFTQTEFAGERVHHLAAVPGLGDRVVTVDGGSKAYGLANIRIGWACGAPELIARMKYHATATSIAIPHVAKAMALAAMRAPADYLAENARECAERAALVERLLGEINDEVSSVLGHEPGVPFFAVGHRPRSGHSVLVSARGLAGLRTPDGEVLNDSVDVTSYFLREAAVCLSPGLSNGFDDCTVRISFGCLGSEHTWKDNREHELSAAADALLREVSPTSTESERRSLMRGLGLGGPGGALSSAGYEGGRAVLVDAIAGRLKRGALRLAEHARQGFATTAGRGDR